MTDTTQPTPPLANALAFIEQQFPVAKVSMESYKERMAGTGQTLPTLGKWWGRKPLVLVQAVLLGLLMPISNEPEKDHDIFLKLMTMDRAGLLLRKSKPISQGRLLAELVTLPTSLRSRFIDQSNENQLKQLDRKEKDELQQLVFERMNYDEKLGYCDRPEQIEGPSPKTWNEINAHLGTKAKNLKELVHELGEKRFGHTPRVGDAFSGGGSIPFEAMRLGCDAYGSDLNPAAALLSWASINIIGSGDEHVARIQQSQMEIFQSVEKKLAEWGIEHNSLGWRADAYLYCVEVLDPETGWKVPLLSTFAVAPKNNTIVRLIPNSDLKRYDMDIVENVSDEEYFVAASEGTVKDSRLIHPMTSMSTPLEVIRNDMRMWELSDFAPRPNDVFQDRLYCIRWVEKYINEDGKEKVRRHYRSVIQDDLQREQHVLYLVNERFSQWQRKGFLPSRRIEPGVKTDEPIRTRGWTYWHHLFLPRQLLIAGLFSDQIFNSKFPAENTLLLGRIINYNSKLSRWKPADGGGIGGVMDVFTNQALNTMVNFGCRPSLTHKSLLLDISKPEKFITKTQIQTKDVRKITAVCDFWITDPPYADAVKYDEISEFFLAWYDSHISKSFPDWYTDSKRALAVSGSDESFRQSMVDCYKRLTQNMPDNGMQVVMFTHQDAAVWADLTMILWAAGLRVTAAWTIATETNSVLKAGNYVQGTVLLVLRKRTESEPLFLDEVNQRVESEVRRQLDEMTRMEDDSDPNFGDSDYQLAAYAAALRVLTGQPIEEINPEKEILRPRKAGETGPVEALIRRAVKIACDHLLPHDLDAELWKQLNPAERFYLKGLEVESHGEYRSGVYQELARGFGANDYTELLESGKANETRLKSASEFGKKGLSGDGFAGSLVRQCLFAVAQVSKSDETREGLNYLKTELPDYWASREKINHILVYLAALRNVSTVAHWHKDAASAGLLLGAVRNDHV